MKKIFILSLCIGVTMSLLAQKSTLDSLFKQVAMEGYSGTVLYAKDGKILSHLASGYRSFESKSVLSNTDIFELASISKQFTAMIIMMCKEKGLLSYDDPINKYVTIPYTGISIRQLLHHTSGLPDYQAIMDQHWDKSKIAGNKDIIEYLNKYVVPVSFQPEDKYEYSNTGYVLLASIAEKVTGKDFIELCNQWIFQPLKMNDTKIRSNEEKFKTKRFAYGHMQDSSKTYVNANKFHSSDYTVWLGKRKGPGRISSTANDLLIWDQALYSDKLVTHATLQEAFTSGVTKDGKSIDYGFGWVTSQTKNGEPIIYHTGSNPGYATIIVRKPMSKETFIMLNNNDHPSIKKLVEVFLR
jgi:CubicO group peptidase (beta-lactamase class C family)